MQKALTFLKNVIKAVIILLALYFLFFASHSIAPIIKEKFVKTVQPARAFPAQEGSIEKKYIWEYQGKQYSISQTLYQSVYDFYRTEPKTYQYSGALSSDWEQQYYAMFIQQNPSDESITNLANSLKQIGQKNGLTDDQIVELTLSFVQSIPYDDAKAKEIISQNNDSPKMLYPYETLFENKGVCSDKSILAYALLTKLGYGSALFVYDGENHMAVAVQCPQQYSTYSSGYCYAETTSVGNKIGVIPSLDSESNKTVEVKSLSFFGENGQQQLRLKALGQARILNKTEGKTYGGIINTIKNQSQIENLQKELAGLSVMLNNSRDEIEKMQAKLDEMRKTLENYNHDGDFTQYNKLAKKYNDLLDQYKSKVASFNKSVTLYNQKVGQYNALVKDEK